MAAQPTRRRGSATPAARKFVMASVRLDVATHARVAAAAALAGMDRSTWIGKAINEALAGIVVFDRRAERAPKLPDQGDLASGERSEEAA